MNEKLLRETAHALVAPGKGILAADESSATADKRFLAVGVEQTEENRRRYRQILFTAPSVGEVLSGVIFYDETFWQNADGGEPFRELLSKSGVLPGIKLDEGLVDLPGFPGEKISKGLDALPDRVAKYRASGARFAKWRSVFAIGPKTAKGEAVPPTTQAMRANAFVLARYARICQDADIVPIVEPEVLFDGTHTSERCEEVMGAVLDEVFHALVFYRVYIPGVILKTSMVLPGKSAGIPIDANDVAMRTARVLQEYCPKDLGGVVFLSGGQVPSDAFANLDAIAKQDTYPWGLTFSYSRALQDPVLTYWAAHRDDIPGAQAVFSKQLEMAKRARMGKLGSDVVAEDFVSDGQDL